MMAESVGPHTDTATASDDSRAVVARNDSAVVKSSTRPAVLVGVRIPSKIENVRQLVVRTYDQNLHLQQADVWAVTRYAELSWKFRRLSELMERLPDGGFLRQDMEPRKVLSELRSLSDTLLRHERDLGITAAARASLGLDLGRMRRLANGGDDPLPEADVQALEQRVLDRLPHRAAEPDSPDDHHGAGECSACGTPGAGTAGERSSSKTSAPAFPAPAPDPPQSEQEADAGDERVKRLKNPKPEESPWERTF